MRYLFPTPLSFELTWIGEVLGRVHPSRLVHLPLGTPVEDLLTLGNYTDVNLVSLLALPSLFLDSSLPTDLFLLVYIYVCSLLPTYLIAKLHCCDRWTHGSECRTVHSLSPEVSLAQLGCNNAARFAFLHKGSFW
jgi:hypothetical protein